MTKHEYVARLNVIDEDKHLGITNRLIVMNNLKREYIASLEAENAALIAKNSKLEKVIDISVGILYDNIDSCPSDVYGWEHPRSCNIRCNEITQPDGWVVCWREFLMQETADGATQIDLHVADATQKEIK